MSRMTKIKSRPSAIFKPAETEEVATTRRRSYVGELAESTRGVLTNFPVEQYIASRERAGLLSWQDRIYHCLNSPSSGPVALVLAAVLSFFTVAATVAYATFTVPGYADATGATRAMVQRVLRRSCYVNLWKLMGDQLQEATYLSVVRNKILIDVQACERDAASRLIDYHVITM